MGTRARPKTGLVVPRVALIVGPVCTRPRRPATRTERGANEIRQTEQRQNKAAAAPCAPHRPAFARLDRESSHPADLCPRTAACAEIPRMHPRTNPCPISVPVDGRKSTPNVSTHRSACMPATAHACPRHFYARRPPHALSLARTARRVEFCCSAHSGQASFPSRAISPPKKKCMNDPCQSMRNSQVYYRRFMNRAPKKAQSVLQVTSTKFVHCRALSALRNTTKGLKTRNSQISCESNGRCAWHGLPESAHSPSGLDRK
jgi:hypothetical protein